MIHRGMITDLKNSFNDFTTVVNRFPDSKYADIRLIGLDTSKIRLRVMSFI